MFIDKKPRYVCKPREIMRGNCAEVEKRWEERYKDKTTWYQDCSWGSCRYVNGIGTASEHPNFTDIDCLSDLRMHAFEGRMDAPWVTHNTLCDNLFSLYPAESTDTLNKATNQKIYTLNNCPGKFL